MDELKKQRGSIDDIDNQILRLLSERKRCIQAIAKIKKSSNIALLDTARWNEILKTRLSLATKLGLEAELVSNIFEDIHEWSLSIQSKA